MRGEARRIFLRGVAALALLAPGSCAPTAAPAAAPPPVVPVPAAGPASPPSPAVAPATPVTAGSGWKQRWRGVAAWSEVSRSDRCLFLSGPAGLGLYTSLEGEVAVEQSGDQLRLVFASGAEFLGTSRAGRVTLQRQGSYEHQKTPWGSTERLEGAARPGQLEARYAYSECDKSGKEGCPSRCTIEGTLELSNTTLPP